jgi:hypothetical protein
MFIQSAFEEWFNRLKLLFLQRLRGGRGFGPYGA